MKRCSTMRIPVAGWLALAIMLALPMMAGAAVVINKVRPWTDDTGLPETVYSKVTLYNSGPASQSLAGWVLSSADGDATLPAVSLPPRCYFDVVHGTGTDDADFSDSAGVFHTGLPYVFDRTTDEVGLYNGAPMPGTMVDFCIWREQIYSPPGGEDYDNALIAGQWSAGLFVDVWEHAYFSEIARIPSGYDDNAAGNWQELDMPYATPMRLHNPLQIEPRDAILDSNVTQLVWRLVPGSFAYQIDVDNDSMFTSPEFSTVLFGAQNSVNVSLTSGFYFWRVRSSIGGSPPDAIWRFYTGVPAIATFGMVAVPQRFQHKDSRLLCIWDLRNSVRGGCTEAAGAGGPWDAAHAQGAHIPNCWHCRQYCTRASIQMVNAKYGGSLTQDEISYHGYENNVVGPEGDLGHGVGMWPQEDNTYSWAMNNAAIAENFIGPPDASIPWGPFTGEINGGWPVLTVIRPPGWFHTVVFNGYFEVPLFGWRFIHIMDPWPGRTGWYLWSAMPCVRYYVLPAGALSGRAMDANVTADNDGDGVVNFDEQHPDPASEQAQRTFCSLHTDPDTEDDEVWDKQEIRSYTFHDIDHGHSNDALTFPDVDGDGLRQECDCDGDNDSDFDGGEDINGDGQNPIGGLETCEYQPDHLIFCGVMLFPGPYLCTEDAYLFGMTYHQFSWYPYEVIGGCPPPIDGQGIGWSGIVFSVANGIIPLQYIGTYGPGIYRVITDVLRDHLYSEPDNWDPWTCFGVPYHCYLIIRTPDLTYTGDFYYPVLDSLNILYDVTLVPPGMDGPTVAQMAPYFVVIYVTGNTPAGMCIPPNDAMNLMQYLDQGGKLMITGDNIGTEAALFPDPMRQQFYTQYLGAQYIQEYPSCPVALGTPGTFLQPFNTFQTYGGDGANYPGPSPDDVQTVPSAGSFSAAQWAPFCAPPTQAAVIAHDNPDMLYRTAYYSLCWENIPGHLQRQNMMDATLDWLYGTPAPLPAVDDLTIQKTGATLALNWTPVAGALNYEIHSATSPNFTPTDATQIGISENGFFDITVTDVDPVRFYAVVATAPSFGGHGEALSTELREWVSSQTDVNVIKAELAKRKVKVRMFTSEENNK